MSWVGDTLSSVWERSKNMTSKLLCLKTNKQNHQTRKYYSDKSKVFIPARLILLQLQLKGLLLDFLWFCFCVLRNPLLLKNFLKCFSVTKKNKFSLLTFYKIHHLKASFWENIMFCKWYFKYWQCFPSDSSSFYPREHL